MRYFQISILLILFYSCSLQTTKGYLEKNITKDKIENSYFSNTNTDYIYKTKISIYNKKFGGILIIKKTGTDSHRVVFTTEFGNKLFDFSIVNDSFKVNYVVDELNKKNVLATLQNDFLILVKESLKVDKQFDSDKEIVFKTKLDTEFDLYYFYRTADQKLFKIIKTTKSKEKVILDFLEHKNDIATKIDILHQNFKLKIHLTYIGN